MENPFDGQGRSYVVLVNGEGQYCLWPVSFEAPEGWSRVHGPAGRQACLEYVMAQWTDLRPRSLVTAVDGASGSK